MRQVYQRLGASDVLERDGPATVDRLNSWRGSAAGDNVNATRDEDDCHAVNVDTMMPTYVRPVRAKKKPAAPPNTNAIAPPLPPNSMLSRPSRLVLSGLVFQRPAMHGTTLNEGGKGFWRKRAFFFARLRDLRAVRTRAAVHLRTGIHGVAS